jgi:hypothetical protein
MRTFEITLPVNSNAGVRYEVARKLFEHDALRIAGGFTKLPECERAWRDPSDGKVYWEMVRTYRIASNPRDIAALMDIAFRTFSDQKAIMCTEVGQAYVIAREHWNEESFVTVLHAMRDPNEN